MSRFRVGGLGFRVWALGLRGLGLRASGHGRVHGSSWMFNFRYSSSLNNPFYANNVS